MDGAAALNSVMSDQTLVSSNLDNFSTSQTSLNSTTY